MPGSGQARAESSSTEKKDWYIYVLINFLILAFVLVLCEFMLGETVLGVTIGIIITVLAVIVALIPVLSIVIPMPEFVNYISVLLTLVLCVALYFVRYTISIYIIEGDISKVTDSEKKALLKPVFSGGAAVIIHKNKDDISTMLDKELNEYNKDKKDEKDKAKIKEFPKDKFTDKNGGPLKKSDTRLGEINKIIRGSEQYTVYVLDILLENVKEKPSYILVLGGDKEVKKNGDGNSNSDESPKS